MNNKKIISVLTALLIVAMAVPVFADNHMEENVKITGEVKTIFEVANYGDKEGAAADLWYDGEVLDDPDAEDYPAKKRFFQEIGFNVTGNVNDNVNFDLALNTLYNQFTKQKLADDSNANNANISQESSDNDLAMDTATLTVGDDVSTMKLGDIAGFHADYTFIDDEDREGMTLDTMAMGSDVSAFVLGNNDNGVADFYGMTATRDLGTATATAKVLNAQDYAGMNVMNLVGALEADVTDMIAVNGKLVMNSSEIVATNSDKSDTFMSAGMTANMNEALTVNGTMEMVGEDFEGVADDTEGANTEMYKVDADYALGAANTVSGAYTLVADDDKDEDKSTIEASLENVMGAYTNTASISMTTNDEFTEESDVTVVKVGTEYAMDSATASAELTDKSADNDNDLTYLTAGLDQQISENVNWNTTVDYVTGTTNDIDDNGVDADATSVETALTVSF